MLPRTEQSPSYNRPPPPHRRGWGPQPSTSQARDNFPPNSHFRQHHSSSHAGPSDASPPQAEPSRWNGQNTSFRRGGPFQSRGRGSHRGTFHHTNTPTHPRKPKGTPIRVSESPSATLDAVPQVQVTRQPDRPPQFKKARIEPQSWQEGVQVKWDTSPEPTPTEVPENGALECGSVFVPRIKNQKKLVRYLHSLLDTLQHQGKKVSKIYYRDFGVIVDWWQIHSLESSMSPFPLVSATVLASNASPPTLTTLLRGKKQIVTYLPRKARPGAFNSNETRVDWLGLEYLAGLSGGNSAVVRYNQDQSLMTIVSIVAIASFSRGLLQLAHTPGATRGSSSNSSGRLTTPEPESDWGLKELRVPLPSWLLPGVKDAATNLPAFATGQAELRKEKDPSLGDYVEHWVAESGTEVILGFLRTTPPTPPASDDEGDLALQSAIHEDTDRPDEMENDVSWTSDDEPDHYPVRSEVDEMDGIGEPFNRRSPHSTPPQSPHQPTTQINEVVDITYPEPERAVQTTSRRDTPQTSHDMQSNPSSSRVSPVAHARHEPIAPATPTPSNDPAAHIPLLGPPDVLYSQSSRQPNYSPPPHVTPLKRSRSPPALYPDSSVRRRVKPEPADLPAIVQSNAPPILATVKGEHLDTPEDVHMLGVEMPPPIAFPSSSAHLQHPAPNGPAVTGDVQSQYIDALPTAVRLRAFRRPNVGLGGNPNGKVIGAIKPAFLGLGHQQVSLLNTRAAISVLSGQYHINISALGEVEFVTRSKIAISEWAMPPWAGEESSMRVMGAAALTDHSLGQILVCYNDPQIQVVRVVFNGELPVRHHLNLQPHNAEGPTSICALPARSNANDGGLHFVTGGMDHGMFHWTSDGNRMFTTPLDSGHAGSINSLSYSFETGHLYSGGADRRLNKFDMILGQRTGSTRTSDSVRHVYAHTPHVSFLETSNPVIPFAIHDWRTPSVVQAFGGLDEDSYNAGGKGDLSGNYWVRGDSQGHIRIWDVRNTKGYQKLEVCPGTAIHHLLWESTSPGHGTILSTTVDNRVMFSNFRKLSGTDDGDPNGNTRPPTQFRRSKVARNVQAE